MSVTEARSQSRILFVKNISYNTTGADLYELFGKYGAIRQIRIGDAAKTKGTAFVVFEEMVDAKNALNHLNGYHLHERYIVGACCARAGSCILAFPHERWTDR